MEYIRNPSCEKGYMAVYFKGLFFKTILFFYTCKIHLCLIANGNDNENISSMTSGKKKKIINCMIDLNRAATLSLLRNDFKFLHLWSEKVLLRDRPCVWKEGRRLLRLC